VALSFDLMLKPQGMDVSRLSDLSMAQGLIVTSAGGPVIGKAPKFLRDLLLFPYVEGLGFAYQLRKRLPWSAISAVYRDPPRSTTQILHPEKYLDVREDPLAVVIPDLSRLLPGCHLVTDDDLGEFALGAVLALHLGDDEGRRAAAGWRGDRYRIWEDDGGRFVIVYRVVVADAQVAAALAGHLQDSMEKRHPGGRQGRGPGAGLLAGRRRRPSRWVRDERRPSEQVPAQPRPRGTPWRARTGALAVEYAAEPAGQTARDRRIAPDRDYEVARDPGPPAPNGAAGLRHYQDHVRPRPHLVELKSIKLYIWSYRNEGAFHEDVTNRILNDFVAAAGPRWIEVVGDFSVRGGIKTVVRASHGKRPEL
jgi:hypothetical protein